MIATATPAPKTVPLPAQKSERDEAYFAALQLLGRIEDKLKFNCSTIKALNGQRINTIDEAIVAILNDNFPPLTGAT